MEIFFSKKKSEIRKNHLIDWIAAKYEAILKQPLSTHVQNLVIISLVGTLRDDLS